MSTENPRPSGRGEVNVGALLDALKDEAPETPVVLSRDAEGNRYSPLVLAEAAMYAAETTYSGEIYDLPDDPHGDVGDPAPNEAVRAFVLWPAN